MARARALLSAAALLALALHYVSGESWTNPCEAAANKGLPFCDTSLSTDARVSDLVSRIPVASYAGLLGNTAGNVSNLDIPAYEWWSEALHGVAGSPGVTFDSATPYATSFPQVINTGASFNFTLPRAIGSTVSTEARAFANLGHAGLTFWAPNVNTFRDPRWGRGQETPGEDPFHSAAYAAEFVSAMQWGSDPRFLKVSSCCKHYAGYSLENSEGVDRYHFDAVITKQDMLDTYLPAFQACVLDANASSIMCSYNEVNGVPSCADDALLNQLARASWGFDGYITSDCGAVDNVQNAHHYTADPNATVAAVLQAGMDIDCGSFVTDHLNDALASGQLQSADVKTALSHLLRVQFRLGLFDPADGQPYRGIGWKDVNTADSQLLALQAARQSVVLLANKASRLPLDVSQVQAGGVAVVGPHGNATSALQGNYAGVAPFLISPLAGMGKYAKTEYALGCDVQCTDTSGFTAAVAAAQGAAATVLFIGIDQSVESEGHDRSSIELPGSQVQLVQAVANASSSPVTVVVLSGSSLDLSPVLATDNVGAVLWAGYPGQSGGQAIADVLFGAYAPAGRLPFTMYPASYTDQISMKQMDMRAENGSPGRSYRFYSGQPVFPFAFGLSYTTFRHALTAAPAAPVAPHRLGNVQLAGDAHVRSDGALHISAAALRSAVAQGGSLVSSAVVASLQVTVTNTGSTSSDEALVVFMQPPHPGVAGAPLRWVVGFDRVHVAAGESVKTVIDVHALGLAISSPLGEWTVVPGTYTAVLGTDAVANATIVVDP